MKITAILLSAGQGTRMKSALPKVLHRVCGFPLIAYALESVSTVSTAEPVVVVGHGAEQVQQAVTGVRFVLQAQQLGTGHAVMQAEPLLKGSTDLVVVTYGDMPLLRAETIERLVEAQRANPGPMSLLTVVAEDPRGFGRIVRHAGGTVSAIVEESVATPAQLAIRELNVGAYCFNADWLWDSLSRIRVSARGEFFLTDTVEMAVSSGLAVQAVVLHDPSEAIGINTRVHLAEAEAVMRERINQSHMLNGVTILDPAATYIEKNVRIGRDTIILPGTHLQGSTIIGERCRLGPASWIVDSRIGNDCEVLMSVAEEAILEDHVDIGPFSHLRKGAHLSESVHVGNFGEVKDSYLGKGVKMGHFSYIGNATIGENTNIGAGTITCNFDGEKKNPTVIGSDVFIGSDTMLVAPVTLGDRARTGAGSVVTKDVPEDTLAVGQPARAIRKLPRR